MGKMKILFVADGRSPITVNWIKYFVESNFELHLASTYPCRQTFELASINIVPVAFSWMVNGSQLRSENTSTIQSKGKRASWLRQLIPVRARTWLRQQAGPFTIPSASERLYQLIERIKPDIVHAMRIPFEGMLTAMALEHFPELPFMVSVWGNDFTLHAPSSRKMSHYTRLTLERADALHTDTYRDQRLAREWGYDPLNPMIVQPCGGGINLDVFHPAQNAKRDGMITIINPRGIRAYVRNDTFFKSIPLVVSEHREVQFLCPAMAGEAQAESWITELDIDDYVTLLPHQSIERMAELFRQSQIIASISTHDGIPNSLLEAIACGCFPIAGDIESIREWITHFENGILVDPGNPQQLAEAIRAAIQDESLRSQAREINIRLVKERAEYQRKMAETQKFYEKIIS